MFTENDFLTVAFRTSREIARLIEALIPKDIDLLARVHKERWTHRHRRRHPDEVILHYSTPGKAELIAIYLALKEAQK